MVAPNVDQAMWDILLMDLTQAPVRISVTTTTATSAALAAGVHRVYSNVDVHLRQGATGQAAATTDTPIKAGEATRIYVKDSTRAYLGGITAAGSGTVYITKMVSPT